MNLGTRDASIDLVALAHPERRRRRGDAVYRGAAIVEARKPGLHVLGESKRRLRQRVEPCKLSGREFDFKGLRGLALLSKAFGARLARLNSAQQSELARLLEKLI